VDLAPAGPDAGRTRTSSDPPPTHPSQPLSITTSPSSTPTIHPSRHFDLFPAYSLKPKRHATLALLRKRNATIK
jgi:hypothetical protein